MSTITLTPDFRHYPNYDPALVIPLTTAFKPSCYDWIRPEDGSTCAPPDFISVWGNHGYYSPGVCPEGYSHGCTRTQSPGTDKFHPFSVRKDETAVSCVPFGFTCFDKVGQDPTNDAYSVVESSSRTTYAPAIEIRWKKSDLALFPTRFSTSSEPASPLGVATPMIPAPTASEVTDSGSNGDQFDMGAVIGIAVGSVTGCLLLLLAGVFVQRVCYRRRHNREQLAQANMPYPQRPIKSADCVVPDIGELGTEMTNRAPKYAPHADAVGTAQEQKTAASDNKEEDNKAYMPYRKADEGFIAELPA